MPRTLVLRGVVDDARTESASADVYFRFADDPKMSPQFLAPVVAGKTATAPIDLKGRDIILYMVSKTKEGRQSAGFVEEGEQFYFATPTVAELASAVYDDTPNEVTLTIANNRGEGTIRILRKVGATDFSEIANVPYDETEYVDEPPIDGDYSYKLIQDGQLGESATKTVTVDNAGSSAGSPPDSLVAVFDDIDTVALNWSNNGGTGDNVIERKLNSGGLWANLATVSSATTSYNDTTIFPSLSYRTYYYRVKNLSAPGYSNEADVFIERQT